MIEKEHVIEVLSQTLKALKEKDAAMLRSLSNQTLHSASIYKDPDAVLLAVTIYSFSKLVERENYKHYPEWKQFISISLKKIEKSISALRQDDVESFRENMISIRDAIENISSKLKEYILEVFRKSAINKASRIYEHGISREETAKLLGVTQWELAEYVGRTGIADIDLSITKPIKERIKFTENLFK